MGLAGRPVLPADKSIAHRAAILAALAEGESEIVGFPTSTDPRSTIDCLRALAVGFADQEDGLAVAGGQLSAPAAPLDCGNSGTTMRLLAGVLAGQPFDSILLGDRSLACRPMERVAEPLRRMGADIRLQDGTAPIRIAGRRLRGATCELSLPSAQVKSAVLLAGLFANGETTVVESTPSRDHTERMLGLDVLVLEGRRHITVSPTHRPVPGLYVIPRDFSAAAFMLVAAAVVRPSAVELRAVGVNPTRTGLLDVLQAMGAPVRLRNVREHRREPVADLWLQNDAIGLTGVSIGGDLIPRLIDELPALAVAAAYAEGTTLIRDAAELRVKESDRIAATVRFLAAMGADVEELEDGIIVRGGRPLQGAEIDSGGDHRIAMAAAVAALAARGASVIHGADAVDVSYPTFWEDLRMLAGEAG